MLHSAVLPLIVFLSASAGAALFPDPLENTIHFSPACTQTYLGSPTLAKLDGGTLLAGMDLFGPGAPRTEDGKTYSLLFRSRDGGKSWRFVTEIGGNFWASLFTHGEALYLLGCDNQYGAIVIRKSGDGGETWTNPVDENTGLLFKDGPGNDPPNYHCAPMPVLEHNGRLYRAFENNASREWPKGFRSFVISADAGADLLRASSWRKSDELEYNQETDPPAFARGAEHLPGGRAAGWLEGNIVADPMGRPWNILRVNSLPVVDRAAMVSVSDDGREQSFDPSTGFIEFPGGMTKFAIRFDDVSNRYWTIANGNTNPENPNQRNSLSLYRSENLTSWKHRAVLLEDMDDYARIGNDSKAGFQYVDFLFDGGDIIFVSRTAYNGAHNYHDANYITFHRIENFRSR